MLFAPANLAIAIATSLVGTAPVPIWTRTMGGSAGDDQSVAIASFASGEVVCCGEFLGTVDFDASPGTDDRTSAGDYDAFTSKLDGNGSYQWTRTIGGTHIDQAQSVVIGSTGDLYVGGGFVGTVDLDPTSGSDIRTSNGVSEDVFLTRLGPDGSYVWTFSFGGGETEHVTGLAVDQDGNAYIVGFYTLTVDFDPGPGSDIHSSNGQQDVFLTKVNADGTWAWSRTFGSTNFDEAFAVAVVDGDPVLTGVFTGTVNFDPLGSGDTHVSVSNTQDVFVTRYGSDGAYQWTRTFGGVGFDEGLGIAADAAGGIVVVGHFGFTADFDPGTGSDNRVSVGDLDVFVARYAAEGTYQWVRAFGGSLQDEALGVACDSAGTILVTGFFRGNPDFDFTSNSDVHQSNGGRDFFLTGLNIEGAYGWTHTAGGTGEEFAFGVSVSSPGEAYVTGRYERTVNFNPNGTPDNHTSNGGTDIWITKFTYTPIETPGSCCTGPACQIVTASGCTALGGAFSGPQSTCAEAACDALYGACCANYQCSFVQQTDCDTLSGTFHGVGSQCDDDLCGPEPSTTWSTFQHDARRSGRTSAVVPASPNRIWSLLTGASSQIEPTIAFDGTIYVQGGLGMVAVNPDGTTKWTVTTAQSGVTATPTVRLDNKFFLPHNDILIKINGVNGGGLCGTHYGVPFATALDASGNCYFSTGTPMWVRKIDPACNEVWTYPGSTGTIGSHVALAPDGGVHAATHFRQVKLSGTDGSELWGYDTSGEVGPMAVGDDGTVYFHYSPDVFVALNSDGSEKWVVSRPDIRRNSQPLPPGIGADGTAYFSTTTNAGALPVLVALSSNGVELWRHTEASGDALPPAVDGNGTIFFPVRGHDVVALAPSDGSEQWRIHFDTDGVDTPVAIADDGTLYVVTQKKYLVAFGIGCQEQSPYEPPFTFRHVVTQGEVIDGFTVGQIQDLAILDDGRVTFQAFVPETGTSGIFTEVPGGGFEHIVRGSMIGGFAIDQVSLPRITSAGDRYLGAYLQTFGSATFLNDVVFVAEHSATNPKIQVTHLERWQYVDANNAGRFLVYLRNSGGSTFLLGIDSATAISAPSVGEGVVDGFIIDQIDPKPIDGIADNGIVAVLAHNTGNGQGDAIVTPNLVLVKTGDVIDSHTVVSPFDSRLMPDGTVYFKDGTDVFRRLPNGSKETVLRSGDYISGQPVLEVLNYAANGTEFASKTKTLGTLGAYLEDQGIAVVNVTKINGIDVVGLGSDQSRISINPASQVAFLAQRRGEMNSLWVATLDWSFDVNQDGQVDATDFAAFDTCIQSPSCTCDEMFDASGNRQVDCADFGFFQSAWTAGGNPPELSQCAMSAAVMAAPEANPGGADNNRYLSFRIPAGPVHDSALRVTLVSLSHPDPANLPQFPPPNFSAFQSKARWVGAVIDCTESETQMTTFKCATLQCAPLYMDWQAELGGQTMSVTGAEIVPSSAYDVQEVAASCQGIESTCLAISSPLRVKTARWGDIAPPFQLGAPSPLTQPNISDVAAVIDKFKALPTAPSIARCDINPRIPDFRVNISDVASTVDSFKGLAYNFPAPSACP